LYLFLLKTMRHEKLHSLAIIIILAIQHDFIRLVDANKKAFDSPQITNNPLVLLDEGTRRLCTITRGGVLDDTIGVDNTIETEITTTKTVDPEKEEIEYSKSPYSFSLLQENDGSKTDPDGIPNRYLRMQNNNRDAAKKAFEATLKWREENDIDTILVRPHPKFDACNKIFPHYFCGRDDTNHVILLQSPGLINLKIADSNEISGEDLLYHYIYEMEYLWQILDPTAEGTMISVIDLTGLNLSLLKKTEHLKVVKMFCSTMDAHFPQRSHKTLLINAPKWFGALFKLISPLLRESTKQKISILTKGKKQDELLKDLLSECHIDGDTKVEDISPSTMEEEMRNFCLARLTDTGVEMNKVMV